jgi:biopolymer transport protein ExbD
MSNQPNNPAGYRGAKVAEKAPMVVYKRELRKMIRKRAKEHEINYLNITAMLDMMTIILVFLLKSMSQSSASLPQNDDLRIPQSVLKSEAAQKGLPVLISKTNITVGDNSVCPVPSDATHGVEGKYKRSGANDLFIVPVGNALQSWRETDRQLKAAMGEDSSSSEAIIIADVNTPYRLLVEVLYTLGQSEFAKFHMMVMQQKKE